MQADKTVLASQAQLSFCCLLVLHATCVSVQEERCTEGTWEAEQRVALVRTTEEDAQQKWLGEEEGKEPNKAEKNAAAGECPFCFYNILCVVTGVSMKTVITLCAWVMSQSVFLCQKNLFRDFWWNTVDSC